MNSNNKNSYDKSFFIYYGSAACIHRLNEYQTLVLDPDNYKDVNKFKSFTYAYLSIGEVNSFRNYFQCLKKNNKLLEKNSIWDSYLIKFDDFWENHIFNFIIPDIINSGYNGIMLDTIDTIIFNKLTSKDKLIAFINKIKVLYPSLKVMINRGFEIINDLIVDSVLLESTITTHDFQTKEYILYEEPYKVNIKNSIKCYSVDYWHKNDSYMINKIRNVALNKGYIPLVTDIKLQDLP